MTKSTHVISSPTVKFSIGDYIALTKPRVVSLLLLTTLAPMFLAGSQPPSPMLILWTMLGGFLAAGGANALNQFADRDIDHIMPRTRRRPLPSSRLEPMQALWFGLLLSLLSVGLLWWMVNPLTALTALSGILFYAFVYTLYLKRSTAQNIVIGGAAGAIPPLVGWTAVANEISLLPIFMFLIVFYWTPPHFWAIALIRRKEYGDAGIPMLPVVAGVQETHWQMLLYSILLFLICLIPVFLGLLGPVYLLFALVLNGLFLGQVVRIRQGHERPDVSQFYRFSLIYLATLFIGMGLDKLFYQAPAHLSNFSLRLPF